MNKYESDFYEWSKCESYKLKNKRFELLDLNNLIQEIEDLGKSERNAIRSHLINLLLHMLKTKYQSDHSCKSWNDSINESRRQIFIYTTDHPSLSKYPETVLNECYDKARILAGKETGFELELFPCKCLWEIEEILY